MNTNCLFSDFLFKLNGCTYRHAPIKKLNSKEIQLRSKPWIKPELSKMIRIKNNLYARTKRQPMNNDIKLIMCYMLQGLKRILIYGLK